MPLLAGQTIGVNAATAGLNAGFGLLGTLLNNRLARDNADYDRKENYKYNEMAAEEADARTRALYADLYSPQAQIQQIKDAGLSPSVFYANGAGGISGQTGAQGAGAGGIQQQTFGLSALDASQIALNNAQARKLNAEADTEQGANERGVAEIATIWAEKGLKEASTALTNANTHYQNTLNYIEDETKDFTIKKAEYNLYKAEYEARKAYWDAEDAQLTWQFNNETFEKRKELIAKQCVELASRTALQYSQKALTDEEKKYVKEYAEAAWLGAKAHSESAAAYGEYIDLLKEQMPKQLELKSEEIGLEKWRIGVDAFNNMIRTAGYVFGATQLGDGGYETTEVLEEEKYDPYGHAHADKKTTKSTKKARLPKKIR